MGSKKVHATTTTKVDDKGTKGESDDVKIEVPKKGGTTTKGYVSQVDKETGKTELVKKGLQRTTGKTLTYAQKEVEKKKIEKERQDIKDAKESGDKLEKTQSQQEISEIKSGRDDAKTGTVLSRWWHKGRAKRKANKAKRLKEKENSPVKQKEKTTTKTTKPPYINPRTGIVDQKKKAIYLQKKKEERKKSGFPPIGKEVVI